jgi:methyl-accepting chemotaxis protein
MNKAELKRLILRCYLEQQFAMLTGLAPVAYLLTLVMGLESGLALKVFLINATCNTPIFGNVLTFLLIRHVVTDAVTSRPTDNPGDRLRRILKAPRKIEIGVLLAYEGSCLVWATWPVIVYGLDPWIIVESVIAFGLLAMVVGVRMSLRMDRVLRPHAVEELHKYPQLRIEGERGFLWPKQRWFLPYSFALFVFATLTVTAMIIIKKTGSGFGALYTQLEKVAPAMLSLVREQVGGILDSLVLPIVGVGGFMTLAAAWCAWEIARHQSTGTDAVQKSIESIASGQPSLPGWVSTDEVGDLSFATTGAFERLRTFSSSLNASAQTLGRSAERLNDSHQDQTEALSTQAASLQETQVTAQEIKQTSMVAAQKAEDVLQQAERADQIGRSGEVALEQSLTGLQEIQQQVSHMSQSIRSLDERARQIANITTTVKSLADRSTMLALNAAIEAVRSGEHGKGFAVVAREIRSLADQSIKATYNVQNILQDLSEAIRVTAEMIEKGSDKVQGSVQQLQSFGDTIRQLSGIVRDNVSSVRQISAAVTQQNQGIGQIFQAVNDLTKIMDKTMASLRTSDEAADQMRAVAANVAGFVGAYDWKNSKHEADTPPPPPRDDAEAGTGSEEQAV